MDWNTSRHMFSRTVGCTHREVSQIQILTLCVGPYALTCDPAPRGGTNSFLQGFLEDPESHSRRYLLGKFLIVEARFEHDCNVGKIELEDLAQQGKATLKQVAFLVDQGWRLWEPSAFIFSHHSTSERKFRNDFFVLLDIFFFSCLC